MSTVANYKDQQKERLNLVEVGGKMIPRDKVCYKPTEKDHEITLDNGTKVTKRLVSTCKAGYIRDEESGALIRIGKVNGKEAKKARKAARDLEEACKL